MIYSNSITKIWIDEMSTAKKIVWVSAAGKNTLAARVSLTARVSESSWLVGIGENDIEPIQQWCEENDCGKRVSFDQFQFRNKQELTMFLLRWSN